MWLALFESVVLNVCWLCVAMVIGCLQKLLFATCCCVLLFSFVVECCFLLFVCVVIA